MLSITRILGFLLALCGSAATLAAETLTIQEPWLREAPPNAPATGGFMRLVNSGSEPAYLVGASCDSRYFGRIELHQTVMQPNGMAQMIAQPEIMIPAQGEVIFKPGDFHLMLMEPKQRLTTGETLTITLTFKDGTTQPISFSVKRMEGMPQHPHPAANHPMNHP